MVRTTGEIVLMFFCQDGDSLVMATVLELAREVRHRLVSKDTGSLTVDYPDGIVSMHLYEGLFRRNDPVAPGHSALDRSYCNLHTATFE